MQSEQHIKRLAHELVLPADADRVVQRQKYWTSLFCSLYFDRCDELIFHDPSAGLIAAESGPELVSLTERFSRNERSLASLHVRSYAVLGSAYRACGHFREAHQRYERAQRLAYQLRVPERERANLFFRMAALWCLESDLEKALVLAHKSVTIYEQEDETVRMRHLGESLSVRGLVHLKRNDRGAAMKDWSAALACTDPKILPRVALCASHNLACELVAGATSPHALSIVESHLARALKLLSSKRRSLPRLRVLWLQGMICMRFGSERHGERIYRKARDGFIDMATPFEMALVSLDLGQSLLRQRRLEELRELSEETVELFGLWCQARKPGRALSLWREMVIAQTVSAQVFSATWIILEEHSFQQALEQKRPIARPLS